MRALSLLLGCVPLLGLIELGLHQYFAARAPGFEDYAALGRRLAELKQPGVPIVVAPSWAEPLVRQASPAAFPMVELARADGIVAQRVIGEKWLTAARLRATVQQALGR